MGRLPNRLPNYLLAEDITDWTQPVTFTIYVSGSLYKAINGATGKVDHSSTVATTTINDAIGDITDNGRIYLKEGDYTGIATSIDTGTKSIIIQGAGWGSGATPTGNGGTRLKVDSTLTDYVIKGGSSSESTTGCQILDLMIDGDSQSGPLGGIYWENIKKGVIRNVFVDDMYDTTDGYGVNILGSGGYGSYYNILKNIWSRRARVGMLLDGTANACTIIGGHFGGNRASLTQYGIWLKSDTCTLIGSTDCENMTEATDTGLRIETKRYHRMFGTRFESLGIGVDIIAGSQSHNWGVISCSSCTTDVQGDGVNDIITVI